MKIFLLPPCFLKVTLLEAQLKVIMVEIRWKGVQVHFSKAGGKIRGKTEELWKYFVQNVCPKSSEISILLSEI